MANLKIPPFLKWAGGKRRVLKQIQPYLPKKIERYFEPFLGGGSFFFFIKQKYNPRFCMISDINTDLIATYKAVRDHHQRLISHLKFFKKNNSQEFYYITRTKFNQGKFRRIRRCAAFIYLNKTCYNGLYRVNLKNEFNVPYGKYNNPEIFNEENIKLANKLLQGVKIKLQDYRIIKEYVQEGDFLYLDPCYDPLKRTSFANYTPKRFGEQDRIELAKFMKIVRDKGASVVLSNNNLPEIRKIYREDRFDVNFVLSSRSINSNPKERGKIKELLITC